jgi:hypothetical protein
MKLGLISLAAIALMGCGTNDSEAIKALDDNGFTSISITDRGFLFASMEGCDEKDGNWYHASATNPAGKRVTMLVCCGAATSFKGCTVRSK